MAWYKSWFGEEYLTLYAHRSESEAAALVRFVSEQTSVKIGHKILDVACGAGRHLSAWHALGATAYGIDLSAALLREAKARVVPSALLCQADMRRLPFADETFELLCSFFTSFGYFETDEEHQDLLTEWARVSAPNAILCLDYLNKEAVVANLVNHSRRETDDFKIEEYRSLSSGLKRVEKKIQLISKTSDEVSEFHESVRMYQFEELSDMLTNAGYSVGAHYGNYDGRAFTPDSPRLLIFATLET